MFLNNSQHNHSLKTSMSNNGKSSGQSVSELTPQTVNKQSNKHSNKRVKLGLNKQCLKYPGPLPATSASATDNPDMSSKKRSITSLGDGSTSSLHKSHTTHERNLLSLSLNLNQQIVLPISPANSNNDVGISMHDSETVDLNMSDVDVARLVQITQDQDELNTVLVSRNDGMNNSLLPNLDLEPYYKTNSQDHEGASATSKLQSVMEDLGQLSLESPVTFEFKKMQTAAALFLMGDDHRGHRLSAQYFEDPNDVHHIVDELNKLVHEGVLKPFPTVFSWLLRFNTLKEVYLHISKGRSDEAVKMYIENLAAQILCAIYAAKPNYVYRFSP